MEAKPLQRPSAQMTFRRSPIEEGKKAREDGRKTSQLTQFLDNLNTSIQDIDSTPDSKQKPVNEPGKIEPVKKLDDKVELITGEDKQPERQGIEETSNESSKQTVILGAIRDKLSQLTSMLQQKVNILISEDTKLNDTTEKILDEKLPDTTVDKPVDVVGQVLPEIDNKREDSKEISSAKEAAIGERFKLGVTAIVDAVKSGFKSTVSVADKISSMLFKYTISAVAKFALMVGAIFAIITGIDLLRINFKYWSEIVLGKINEWIENITKWTPWLEGTFTALEGIRTAWEKGDWPGLAEAIILGLGKMINEFANLISLGFYKAISKALDALGFSNAAKGIEGFALQNYANNTDNALSEADQKKLAEYQNANLEKGAADISANGGVSAVLPMWLRKKLHLVTEAEANLNGAERKDRDALMKVPKEQRIETIMSIDNTKSALTRYENHSNSMNLGTERDNSKLDEMKKQLETMINDKNLDNVPTVKAEFKTRLAKIQDSIEKKRKAVKPQSAEKSRETVTINNIKKLDAIQNSNASTQGAKTTATVNNTLVKSNKSVNIVTPTTNTAAPGIYNGTGVN